MNVKWERCPSVMTGGKPYFLYTLEGRNRLYIIWDRYEGAWCCMVNDKKVRYYGLMENARKYFRQVYKPKEVEK